MQSTPSLRFANISRNSMCITLFFLYRRLMPKIKLSQYSVWKPLCPFWHIVWVLFLQNWHRFSVSEWFTKWRTRWKQTSNKACVLYLPVKSLKKQLTSWARSYSFVLSLVSFLFSFLFLTSSFLSLSVYFLSVSLR